MEKFQKKAKSHQKVESIADMKTFVETYPHFKVCIYLLSKEKSYSERISPAAS
jgi:vacuolar protein sorting-associated protein 45